MCPSFGQEEPSGKVLLSHPNCAKAPYVLKSKIRAQLCCIMILALALTAKKSRLDKDIYNSLGPYLNDATSKVRTGLFAIFQDPILFCNVITPDAKMLNFNLFNLK